MKVCAIEKMHIMPFVFACLMPFNVYAASLNVCYSSVDFTFGPIENSKTSTQAIIIRDANGSAIAKAKTIPKQCGKKYYYNVGCQRVDVPINKIGYILEVGDSRTSVLDSDAVIENGVMAIIISHSDTLGDRVVGNYQIPVCPDE